ncbi:hypothetical protein BDF22DRAFT_252007 [Syncephalis plumigaleata]|nr:hypothetical protein BDF22DRAFT_252007 [Syncephalis plumigaleata]
MNGHSLHKEAKIVELKSSSSSSSSSSNGASSSGLASHRDRYASVRLEIPEPKTAKSVNIEEIENTSQRKSSNNHNQFVYIENDHGSPSQGAGDNLRMTSVSSTRREGKHDNLSAYPSNETLVSTGQRHASNISDHAASKRVSLPSSSSSPPPAYAIADPSRKNDPALRNKPYDQHQHHQLDTPNQGVTNTHVYNSSLNHHHHHQQHQYQPSSNNSNGDSNKRPISPEPVHNIKGQGRGGRRGGGGGGDITSNPNMFPPPQYRYHLAPPPSHATRHPVSPKRASPSPPAYTANDIPYTSLPPDTYMIESHGRFTIVEDPSYEEALHDQRWRRSHGDQVFVGRNTAIPLSMIFWLFGWLFPLLWMFGIYWIRSPIVREKYWAYMCAMNVILLAVLIIIVAIM